MNNRTTVHLSGIVLSFFFSGLFAQAAGWEEKRPAIITDPGGSESQVAGLHTQYMPNRFGIELYEVKDAHIVVITPTIHIAVPIWAVNSIDTTNTSTNKVLVTFTVAYSGKADDTSVSGMLVENTLFGKTDFGDYRLYGFRLKKLQFKERGMYRAPTNRIRQGRDPKPFPAVFLLTDGSRVSGQLLQGHTQYEDSWAVDVPVDGSAVLYKKKSVHGTKHEHWTEFQLQQGDTVQDIPFEKIQTIEFGPDETVTVTATTGIRMNMKQSRLKDRKISGFMGMLDTGYFYIPVKHVKRITFGPDEAKQQ